MGKISAIILILITTPHLFNTFETFWSNTNKNKDLLLESDDFVDSADYEGDSRRTNEVIQDDKNKNQAGHSIKKSYKPPEMVLYKSKKNGRGRNRSYLSPVKSNTIIPFYNPRNLIPCSCGINYRLLDLGSHYYPRYLPTGVCHSKTCTGIYKCNERHYQIRVLKQKNTSLPREEYEEEENESGNLPGNLRDDWNSELVEITVGCECTIH